MIEEAPGDDEREDMDPVSDAPAPKPISPAAERALAEAAERRAAAERAGRDEKNQPSEVGGRNGPEPTRYGDWEKGGITSDF